MTTHTDLIQRLEAATGPDRELDGWIFRAVHGYGISKPPAYTYSLAKAGVK